MLRAVNPDRAELYFMMGQFGYSIVTEFPAIFVLYDSPGWSMIFLAVIFAASGWNGGGYYIEVFGRKSVELPISTPGPFVLTEVFVGSNGNSMFSARNSLLLNHKVRTRDRNPVSQVP